jgi:hypothetical protein
MKLTKKQITLHSMERIASWKATTSHLMKNFPLLYGNRSLITMFKRARQVFILSQKNPFPNLPSSVSKINFNIIFPTTSRPFKYSVIF